MAFLRKPSGQHNMLVECAADGFRVLDAHFRAHPEPRFVAEPFVPAVAAAPTRLGGHLVSNNPDLFYSALSVLHSTPDGPRVAELVRCEQPQSDLVRMLDQIRCASYVESEFERELADKIAQCTSMTDQEIREVFSRKFAVSKVDITALPIDRSIFFAKVNHGYWEYMRSAYDGTCRDAAQFREIDVQSKIQRLRTSGVTQFWGRQIRRMLAHDAALMQKADVRLCISLTAGTEPPALSIRKELGPVTRGAAVGLLAMFSTATPEREKILLGDGSATRALIFDRKLSAFMDKYVADSEACLLLVPPHLRQIQLLKYGGRTYRFMVPATRVNETWKAVAATLLGYLSRLARRHKTITVLGQGASIASLVGLVLADADSLPGVRLRYFDLGRVLDVAAPEFLARQAWAKGALDSYVAEGKKAFRMGADSEPALATAL